MPGTDQAHDFAKCLGRSVEIRVHRFMNTPVRTLCALIKPLVREGVAILKVVFRSAEITF